MKQAISVFQAFQTTKDSSYIDEAVKLTQHATECALKGDDKLAGYLTTLAAMHQHHYKAFGDDSSLDGAVMAAKRAVDISSDDDDDQNLYIRNLTASLRYRFSENGNMEHLVAAVSIMQQLVKSMSAGRSRLQALQSLFGLQRLLFEKTSDTRQLDEATCTTNLLLSQVQGADRVDLLYNLCDLSDMRLEQFPTVENLDKCIRVCRDIMAAIPAEDGRRPGIMYNISVYYARRYTQGRCVEDLKQAIEFNQMAIGSTDIELVRRRTSLLEGLAQKFMLWYEQAREFPLLDESILDRHIKGDKTNEKDLPEKATWLFMLSRQLEAKVLGMDPSNDALDDLEMSMVLVYEALEATVDHHHNWEDMVDALRRQQRLWSERTGKIPDTPEIATLLFRKGGRWIPPELAEGHDFARVPYCIMVGDLDAVGDEASKQPVVQCLTAAAEVNKDQRHTLVHI
ncbi:hypothetical protein F5883DRAFT_526787 [Diaporthe sp. PMI_573]|nr:hypothetical protein F5883DRAFT_526787 [Diaporthaceae sp. PMI_573]